MGKASRVKGAAGEREVAAIFQDAGFDVNRVPNSGALRIKGDLYGVGVPWHIEVKRKERLDLWASLAQAEAECGAKEPVLCFRRNRSDWYGAMKLAALVELIRV